MFELKFYIKTFVIFFFLLTNSNCKPSISTLSNGLDYNKLIDELTVLFNYFEKSYNKMYNEYTPGTNEDLVKQLKSYDELRKEAVKDLTNELEKIRQKINEKVKNGKNVNDDELTKWFKEAIEVNRDKSLEAFTNKLNNDNFFGPNEKKKIFEVGGTATKEFASYFIKVIELRIKHPAGSWEIINNAVKNENENWVIVPELVKKHVPEFTNNQNKSVNELAKKLLDAVNYLVKQLEEKTKN